MHGFVRFASFKFEADLAPKSIVIRGAFFIAVWMCASAGETCAKMKRAMAMVAIGNKNNLLNTLIISVAYQPGS